MKLTEYETVSIYVPESRRLGSGSGQSFKLNPDLIEWADMMYGYKAPDMTYFVANLDNDAYGWAHGGMAASPNPLDNRLYRKFMFKKESDALMFKLTWGGN